MSGFKKIHIPALPTIGLQDGPNIPYVRDALQHQSLSECSGAGHLLCKGCLGHLVALWLGELGYESS
jgi:hypothetical protein